MQQNHYRTLSTDELTFEPTQGKDLDWVVSLENAEENRRFVCQWPKEKHLKAINDPDKRHFIFKCNEQYIGYAILQNMLNEHRTIDLYRIVIDQKGQGFGHKALQLIKEFAFNENQAHRLRLNVLDYNQKAYDFYLKDGFVQEGVLRECVLMDNQFYSLIVMSMLKSEFKS